MENLSGKKILLVFCSFGWGGAERQGMHLARYLKEQGCEVHVWSTLLRGGGVVADICDDLGIPWEEHRFLWPCRKSSLLRDGFRFWQALRRLRPDVILSYTSSPNVACGLVWKFSGAKACIWGQRNVHLLLGNIVEKLVYRAVSGIICNAAHEIIYLRSILGESAAPLHIIHNGIVLETKQLSRREWRNKLKINDDAVVFTMLANLGHQKDHITLLQAWKRLVSSVQNGPELHLLLAGALKDSYTDVHSLAVELGLSDIGNCVHFIGSVEDVAGLLEASDIGILSSEKEGLPNAVLEYMAAGLPVLASDLPGVREALGDAADGQVFPVGDVETLTVRLLEFVKHPQKFAELAERNRSRVESEFSLKSMCDKTTELMQQLLNRE